MTAVPDVACLYLKTLVSVLDRGRWTPIGLSSALKSGPVHVITAWNPGNQRPDLAENEAANRRLEEELLERRLQSLPARGCDPDSAHCEESFIVSGLTDREACEIGARYGQVAVFRITSTTQTVLGCFDNWTIARPLDSDDTNLATPLQRDPGGDPGSDAGTSP